MTTAVVDMPVVTAVPVAHQRMTESHEDESQTFRQLLDRLAQKGYLNRYSHPSFGEGYCFTNPKSDLQHKKDMEVIEGLCQFLNWRGADHFLSPDIVNAYVCERRDMDSPFGEKVSDGTIKKDIGILNRIFNMAVYGAKLLDENPVETMNKAGLFQWSKNQPKKRSRSRRCLDADELARITDVLDNILKSPGENRSRQELAFCFLLMRYTGSREAQLRRIKLENIKPAAGVATIDPRDEKSAKHRTGDGRVMILDPLLNERIRIYAEIAGYEYDLEKGFMTKDCKAATGVLFPSLQSTSNCDEANVSSRMSKFFSSISELSQVDCTAYSLRHTVASVWANAAHRAKIDLEVVADHLGDSVRTLMGSYLKKVPVDLEPAIAETERLLTRWRNGRSGSNGSNSASDAYTNIEWRGGRVAEGNRLLSD